MPMIDVRVGGWKFGVEFKLSKFYLETRTQPAEPREIAIQYIFLGQQDITEIIDPAWYESIYEEMGNLIDLWSNSKEAA